MIVINAAFLFWHLIFEYEKILTGVIFTVDIGILMVAIVEFIVG